MKSLEIERSYTPYGVWGRMHMPSGLTLSTLERPWEGNAQEISCIPSGVYVCKRVDSPAFGDTFQVTDVAGRSHILFHAGNGIENSKGCILVAQRHAIWDNALKIGDSKKGFEEFMAELEGVDEFELIITTYSPEYP